VTIQAATEDLKLPRERGLILQIMLKTSGGTKHTLEIFSNKNIPLKGRLNNDGIGGQRHRLFAGS